MDQGLSEVLDAVRANAYYEAEHILWGFLKKTFGNLTIVQDTLRIRKDTISLNSVNGTFADQNGQKYFFKFHHEEGESETLEEYYKANLLSNAGYPTEIPLFISQKVGAQILIYEYVAYKRLFDLCQLNEQADTPEAKQIIHAQQALDRLNATKCLETLTLANSSDYKNESLLQLFFWRLVDQTDTKTTFPGGRYKRFYVDQNFSFPSLTLPYTRLKDLRWVINGRHYDITLADAFTRAYDILNPERVTSYAACTAHGDAHNGNVWFKPDGTLSYFDPAFAGEKIPALLAEVKATFHNIFAHPNWLYNPEQAQTDLKITAELKEGTIHVTHNWCLTPLRNAFLNSKSDLFWIPVLQSMSEKGWLPDDWEAYIRAALFCCPTLVMNLRASAGTHQNEHTPETSLLGWVIALMCAQPPTNGTDIISVFFKKLSDQIN